MKVEAELTNVGKLIRKLEGNELYKRGWVAALKEAMGLGYESMTTLAPTETETLKGSLNGDLDPRPIPLWGKISTDVTTSNLRSNTRPGETAFRYPWALHGSRKYHYRQGPLKGMTTYHWAKNAIKAVQRRISGILGKAVQAIEQDWAK